MARRNHKVKFPCNHLTNFRDLTTIYQVRPLSPFPVECRPPAKCHGCHGETGFVYYCSRCNFHAHENCIDFPETINHRSHGRHPLKLVRSKTINYTDGRCHFCRKRLHGPIYHCSLCNFSIDFECTQNKRSNYIYIDLNEKIHNHPFALLPRVMPFTCSACAMDGQRDPYVCYPCGFMVHYDCIYLPRVININRHEHRISHTYHLGHNPHGDWECGVCRKQMNPSYGGFSCKCCPIYAVHSKCATRLDVWDLMELEDTPEEEEEETEDPFKVINEKEIIHFSHEHNLRLSEDYDTGHEKIRCDACILPLSFDPFFKCVQCEFFLHKECASLPRKKQHLIHNHRLVQRTSSPFKAQGYKCKYCLRLADGFIYTCFDISGCYGFMLDLRCASISEPFNHELHPHPLYRTASQHETCRACGKDSEYVLSCLVCEFAIGMECATLPRKVKHICDEHVLSLHHGAGNAKGQLWCDICEGTTDPSVWFYGCDDCGTAVHIKCVLGDLYYLKPGKEYYGGELVANNGMARPFCVVCQKRCISPFFLKGIARLDSTFLYACSMECADGRQWKKWYDAICQK